MAKRPSESGPSILLALERLPVLPEMTDMLDEATKEIGWAAISADTVPQEERKKQISRAEAEAKKQIEKALKSMKALIYDLEGLGNRATKKIDRQADHDPYVENIGYTYVYTVKTRIGALQQKAKDALDELREVKAPGGRPNKFGPAWSVTHLSKEWYEKLTGKPITRQNDAYGRAVESQFESFLREVFLAIGLDDSVESLTKRIMEKSPK
ncbi:MAG: hypothetical protein ISQ90_04610 [Rhodospirillales bacterium]|nr:hypothetical protein [Rhodospirillales bacterium]